MKKILLFLVITILSLFAISCSNQSAYDTQIKDSNTSSEIILDDDKKAEENIVDSKSKEMIEVTKREYNEKINEELKSRLETISDNEYISITVYLQSPKHNPYNVSDNYIKQLADNRAFVFERNLRILNENKVNPLTFKNLTGEQFKQLSQITDDIYSNSEMDNMIQSIDSVEEIYVMYEYTKSMHNYRQRVKNANQARNKEFYDMLDTEKCKDINMSSLLSLVQLECKKSYILEIQEISIVSNISYNNPNIFLEPDLIES